MAGGVMDDAPLRWAHSRAVLTRRRRHEQQSAATSGAAAAVLRSDALVDDLPYSAERGFFFSSISEHADGDRRSVLRPILRV